jgi:PAS domain-containing protein
MELEPAGGPGTGAGFEKPETTLELELEDLESTSEVASDRSAGAPPPTPPRAALPREVVIQLSAEPARVIEAGPAVEPLLGYPGTEVKSWSAQQWFEKVHQPALSEQLSQMWSGLVGRRFEPGALPEQTMEYPLVHRDGSVIKCTTTWRAVQAPDGMFQGLEVVIRPKEQRS